MEESENKSYYGWKKAQRRRAQGYDVESKYNNGYLAAVTIIQKKERDKEKTESEEKMREMNERRTEAD